MLSPDSKGWSPQRKGGYASSNRKIHLRHVSRIFVVESFAISLLEDLIDKTKSYRSQDMTEIDTALQAFQVSPSTFVKITLSKLAIFADMKTLRSFQSQELAFRQANTNRDHHADFTVHLEMKDYLTKVLAVKLGLGNVRLASTFWFWVFTLTGMTVPYRCWFSKHCQNVEITLTKEVAVKRERR